MLTVLSVNLAQSVFSSELMFCGIGELVCSIFSLLTEVIQ